MKYFNVSKPQLQPGGTPGTVGLSVIHTPLPWAWGVKGSVVTFAPVVNLVRDM